MMEENSEVFSFRSVDVSIQLAVLIEMVKESAVE
jgi:hypothetical protein